MESLPNSRPIGRSIGTRRRHRARLVALVAGLTAVSAIAIVAPRAGAAPKECPGGGPPPCDVHDPTTTSSTVRQQPNWSATVSVLDQTAEPAGAIDPQVRGYWKTAGGPYVTQSGDTTWTDATHTEGSLSFFAPPLPSSPVGFQLFELGKAGPLCRSTPVPAVLPTGRIARVLLAPEITETSAQLQTLADQLVGRVSPDPAGAQVTISDAQLQPLADGLVLTLHGHTVKDMTFPIPDVDADFRYVVVLHLAASHNVGDPSEVMTVHADPGVLQLIGSGITDKIELAFSGDVEPDFRAAVQGQAMAKLNSTIATNAEVQWFAALGYTVSVRTVTTIPDGLPTVKAAGVHLLPALCKVD